MSRRPLYGWLGAQAVSLTGTRVSMIALPLFVLETTGSPTRTGVVALCESLPLVVTKVLGGPVIDRLGARRVALTCDLSSVVVVGAIPLLHALGLLGFPALLVLVALAGSLRGPGDSALNSLIPSLTAAAGVTTERVTGLESTVERSATLAGATLGGVLVVALGGAGAIAIDAVSFGLASGLLWWATGALVATGDERGLETVARATSSATDDPSYVRRLREGWDFLRGDRVLLGITVMVSLTNLLDAAWVSVLLPVWAVRSGNGAGAFALVLGVFGAASMIGSAAAAVWGARLPRFHVYLVAFLVAGAPRYVTYALDSPLAVVLVVTVLAGVASGFLNPILGAVVFERIPAPLMGRVTSLSTAMCFSLIPLGGLLGGLAVSGIGLAPAMAVSGVAYLVVTMLPAVDPRWRGLDDRPDQVGRISLTEAHSSRT